MSSDDGLADAGPGLMILHILKATEEHRCTQTRIRCVSYASDSDVQEGRVAVSDLRPGGARPVDEENAADQSGSWASAVLICSIPLSHRGVPRQVARGALSVSFRVCLWPSDPRRSGQTVRDVLRVFVPPC